MARSGQYETFMKDVDGLLLLWRKRTVQRRRPGGDRGY